MLAALERDALLLDSLQGIVPHRGAQTDDQSQRGGGREGEREGAERELERKEGWRREIDEGSGQFERAKKLGDTLGVEMRDREGECKIGKSEQNRAKERKWERRESERTDERQSLASSAHTC